MRRIVIILCLFLLIVPLTVSAQDELPVVPPTTAAVD